MRRIALAAAVIALLAVVMPMSASTAGEPSAPAGLTAIALDGSVGLSWQPVSGATSYIVYRGANANNISTAVTPSGGVTSASFSDGGAVNGTTYYYVVHAVASGIESADSQVVSATPRARACSTGNPIVVENCYPGDTGWRVANAGSVSNGGIEGYATASSINRGDSVNLKVNAGAGSTFRAEIYRAGYYGGSGARLISIVQGVPSTSQPACNSDSTTGLVDCSNWATSLALTTTTSWPTGVYMIRLVREDTGGDNQVLLTVRDDSSHSGLLFGVPYTTYQAYNNYGGRSLYDSGSSGSNTVAGTPRAVKVSYDRPYQQPRSGLRNWFTLNSYPTVYWLEREGYDVSYIANTDLEVNGSLILNHKTYVSGSHDEYWSSAMRSALENARSAGINLFFTGSNGIYWKVRFEDSSIGSNRIEVCYKTTQSGPADPSGIPTTTWRDPNGANSPENALIGEMYVGDNDSVFYPLTVSASQGTDRVYRFTSLASQAPGTSTTFGNNLVGWEWDARFNNGAEPPGVQTLSASTVSGELVQNNGASYTTGSTTATMTKYTASSGALVVATGTNYWERGLANDAKGSGNVNPTIQQITTNVLADMGAQPQTPAPGIVLDSSSSQPAPPTNLQIVSTGVDNVGLSWSAVTGAGSYNVYRTTQPRQGGLPLGTLANAQPVTGTSFTDTGLASSTTYYYVATSVASGVESSASAEASATTAAVITGPFVSANAPIDGAAGITRSVRPTATFSTAMDGSTITSSTFTLTASGSSTPVAASVSYDDTTHVATLVPSALLALGTTYTVRLDSTIKGADGTPLGGTASWSFTTDSCPCSLFASTLTPAKSNLPVQDGRTGTGPFSYELGVKVTVDQPATLTAIRYWKSSSETGTHTGKVWTAGGTQIASVTFTSESASGWQQQALTTPLSLQPGTTYVISVNANAYFASTVGGLASAAISPPLRSIADGANGVFGSSAGTFPNKTYKSSNYFVDASVSVVGDPSAPTVVSMLPTSGSTGVAPNGSIKAQFSRSMDASTITSSSFSLAASNGTSVPASVSYDDTTKTATLTPSSGLTNSTLYTANLTTAVRAADGTALAGPVQWSFTTAASTPVQVTSTVPANGASNAAPGVTLSATFSKSLQPTSITNTTFTLTGPAGQVTGTVSYDGPTMTASLTPGSPLGAGTYTARLDGSITATDGTQLGTAYNWSFSVPADALPLTVTPISPAAGATQVSPYATVSASLSRAADPATVTSDTVRLRAPDSSLVSASVTYDSNTKTVTLTPTSTLLSTTTYTFETTSGIQAAGDGSAATPANWTFTTNACPCSLFSPTLAPASTGNPVRDGRPQPGPWSYEMGVKIQVSQASQLQAIRFYKDAKETGTHIGTVWTSTGTKLATITFANETASGWQQQSLPTPLTLQPGSVYVVSVGLYAYFDLTKLGLLSQVVTGPLMSVADGKNGVYGSAAGVFPTSSYNSSNYFIDLVVR